MNLEPRTVELSRSNFDGAIETFLRATDTIHDSETPERWVYQISGHNDSNVKVTIHFKQEVQQPVDHTVH